MVDEKVKLDGFEKKVKYPILFSEYVKENAVKETDPRLSDAKTKEALSALVPIGVSLVGIAGITWYLTRNQKEHIEKEYLE